MQKLKVLLNIKYTMYIVFNSIRIIFQHFLNKALFRHLVCSNSYTKISHNFSIRPIAEHNAVECSHSATGEMYTLVYTSRNRSSVHLPENAIRKVEDNAAVSNCNFGRSPNILR